MLGVNRYDKAYVTRCRDLWRSQLDAYRAFVAASRVKGGGEVADAFEAQWSAHLVLVLDRYFVHRLRGQEGKDGNPLNEVRLLCASMLEHRGVMTGDKTIKYDPARSVLAIPLGASVALTLPAVERLADAFFRAIDAKFTS